MFLTGRSAILHLRIRQAMCQQRKWLQLCCWRVSPAPATNPEKFRPSSPGSACVAAQPDQHGQAACARPTETGPPVDDKTPREYVQLAETANLGADVNNAISLIDKARMRLLDRSAASNGSDPAIYKTIDELSTAKRLLSTEDYTGSLRVLDTALGSLN